MEVKTAQPATQPVEQRYASGGPGRGLVAQNLAKAFAATVERLGDEVAIRDPERRVELTWNDVRSRVARIAGGLAQLGVGKGDTVALMLNNRWEFIPIDLAAVSLGAVPFSIYQTSSPEQISYVVGDAGAKVAVVEGVFGDQFAKARGGLPDLEHVIVVDGEGADRSLGEIEELNPGFDPEPAIDAIGPDDLLTLIYTSGTTGPPKGVQLTHRNLMSLISGVEDVIEIPERGGKVISWLPAAHIAERGANYYLPVIRGLTVTVCPDPRKVVEFLPQVKPTWFFAVPRIWEKVKAGIEAKVEGESSGLRKKLTLWAIDVGRRKTRAEQEAQGDGGGPSRILLAQHALADRLVLSKLRERLGLDEINGVHVGAAPTPLEVLEFFHGIGIEVGELWGLSETCGVATCNPPDRVKLGTVGPPVPGVEVKLAEDGEVLVRGDSNMAGYRNMPEKTAETIDDSGWLHSGDIGELDDDGYLKIVDRKKELIINAAGKNMSPANIEAKLKTASPLIGQAIAIGDQRPYNVALIALDTDFAPGWAKDQGIGDTSLERLASDEKVIAAIQEGVDEANAKLARVEQIKRFRVLATEWEPGGDELTPTMKLKRKPIADKYAEEIEALYAG